MDFSTPFKYSGVAVFSPDGSMIASSAGVRLCVRDVQSLEVKKVHTCVDKIGSLDWSSDSCLILCALLGRDIVQVFAVDSVHQVARIDEGMGGLRAARWLPSGRHILTVADFTMRATVWSLLHKDDVKHIKQPKTDDNQEIIVDFTRDMKYMGLIERRDCKDFILVIDLDSLVVVRRWEVEGTSDIQKLKWSPDGCRICCMDSMFVYRIIIYALDGKLLSIIAPPKAVLGAKSLAWSEDSRLLAIGGYDGKCRVISHITWKEFVCLEPPSSICTNTIFVFKEEEVREATDSGSEVRRSKYVIPPQPFQVPQRQVVPDKAPNKLGVTEVAFSYDGQHLYSIDESTPLCVWIWSMTHMCLEAVLVQQKPVRMVQWHPSSPCLGICTGDRRFYVWSPKQCTCVDMVDPDFTVKQFSWSATGQCLLLHDRLTFCVAYPRWDAM